MATEINSGAEGIEPQDSLLPRWHTLRMSYPVLGLLPDGAQLHLCPPQDCSYREKPRLGSYHLTDDNLMFFHRFPTNPEFAPRTFDEDMSDFLTAVHIVASAPGQSFLFGASFRDSDGLVQHIFCLMDMIPSEAEGFCYAASDYFQLSDQDLASLVASRDNANDREWLDTLYDLIRRCSDRAYLNVMKVLGHNIPELAREPDNRYWNTEPNTSGQEIIPSQLRWQLEDGRIAILGGLDAQTLQTQARQQTDVLLPCGHTELYVHAQIIDTSDTDCLQASCSTCGETVLTPEYIKMLKHRFDRAAREKFNMAEADLVTLDVPVLETDRLVNAGPQVICHALEDMLDSFEVPASANPSSLALVNLPETRIILRAIKQDLQFAGEDFRAPPTSLLHDLEAAALRTLQQFPRDSFDRTMEGSLPPGLPEFVGNWLRRVVNFLSGVQRTASEDEVEDLTAQLGEVQVSYSEN